MKDFIVQTWCDLCYDDDPDGQRIAATDHIVGCIVVNNQTKPVLMELDVCDRHAKELDKLEATFGRMGVPLVGKGAQGRMPPLAIPQPSTGYVAKRGDCPICGNGMTRAGITNHIWNVHIQQPRSVPDSCPDCDVTFDSSVGLGKHRSAVHGYDPIAEAVAVYEHKLGQRKGKA